VKGWVIDTCILLDVLEADPRHGEISAKALEARLSEGLFVCPVTMVEVAPAFQGDIARAIDFLGRMGAVYTEPWTWQDTLAAHRAWAAHVESRRSVAGSRRPVADVLIGAYASRFSGLVTRNARDFRRLFPHLTVADPSQNRLRV